MRKLSLCASVAALLISPPVYAGFDGHFNKLNVSHTGGWDPASNSRDRYMEHQAQGSLVTSHNPASNYISSRDPALRSRDAELMKHQMRRAGTGVATHGEPIDQNSPWDPARSSASGR
jgi:hypothetical protein